MAKKQITFYYAHISPWSYMAFSRIKKTAEEHGADILYKPVSLRHIFPLTGGIPIGQRHQSRLDYRLADLKRWIDYLGIEMNLKPAHFPVDDSKAGALAYGALAQGRAIDDFSYRLLRAVWYDDLDISQDDTLIEIAQQSGLDGRSLLANQDQFEPDFIKASQEAVDAGVFGAPSFVIDPKISRCQ
ncbi:MAG: DsbA family protein, partial [Pseudomonadota bacterium]